MRTRTLHLKKARCKQIVLSHPWCGSYRRARDKNPVEIRDNQIQNLAKKSISGNYLDPLPPTPWRGVSNSPATSSPRDLVIHPRLNLILLRAHKFQSPLLCLTRLRALKSYLVQMSRNGENVIHIPWLRPMRDSNRQPPSRLCKDIWGWVFSLPQLYIPALGIISQGVC